MTLTAPDAQARGLDQPPSKPDMAANHYLMGAAAGPTHPYIENVLDFALEQMRAGERIAIATLVLIEGSSPRSPGAQMVIGESGRWAGYLSGGCIERAVVAEALAAIEAGKNRRVRYGRGSKYLDIQLPCGSAIEILFDVTVSKAELEHVYHELKRRRPTLLRLNDENASGGSHVRHYLPRRRLIVAGIGPAAAVLCRFALHADYEVVLQSPDQATLQALQGTTVATHALGSSGCSPRLDADSWSAIVLMFHDHAWERNLAPAALATQAFYIGAMGSRKTHQQRLEMLESAGVSLAQVARLRAPCGLFKAAKTASGIAISILAEILETEHAAFAEPLSHANS